MEDFTQAWKQRAHDKKLTARDMFDRCIMKAVRAKSNEDRVAIAYSLLKKTFTPITNTTKLLNGAHRWNFTLIAYHAKYSAYDAYQRQPNLGGWWLMKHMTEEEFQVYREIVDKIWSHFCSNSTPDTEYSFFFVRQDISPEYQLVQNSHVALKLGYELCKRDINVDGLHFVCIGVPDMEGLKKAAKLIYTTTFEPAIEFVEPDIGNEVTAVASVPINAAKKHAFHKYTLLKFKE